MAEEDYDDDREARIFTSGGSLNLNSTFLTAAGDSHLVMGMGHDHFSNNECDGRKEKGCPITHLFDEILVIAGHWHTDILFIFYFEVLFEDERACNNYFIPLCGFQ